jgi:hypothetical protein
MQHYNKKLGTAASAGDILYYNLLRRRMTQILSAKGVNRKGQNYYTTRIALLAAVYVHRVNFRGRWVSQIHVYSTIPPAPPPKKKMREGPGPDY